MKNNPLLTKNLTPYVVFLLVNLTLFLLCMAIDIWDGSRWLNDLLGVPLGALLGGGVSSMNPLLNPYFFAGVFLLYWIRRPFLSISGVVVFSFLYQLYLKNFTAGWKILGVAAPGPFSAATIYCIYGGILFLSLIGTVESLVKLFTKSKHQSDFKRPVGDHLRYAVGSILITALLAYAPFFFHQSAFYPAHQSVLQASKLGENDQKQVKESQLTEAVHSTPLNQYESLVNVDLSGSDKERFSSFIRKHRNEVVYLRAWADSKTLSENQGNYSLSLTDPSCHEDFGCGGVTYIFSMMKPNSDGSVGWAQGNYMIDGFFLVTPIAGIHQGWVEVKLEELKRSEIILKMGSPPK